MPLTFKKQQKKYNEEKRHTVEGKNIGAPIYGTENAGKQRTTYENDRTTTENTQNTEKHNEN